MKILHISTHNENCGIGKYQEAYLEAMRITDPTVEQVFFPYSPNQIRIMNKTDLENVYRELKQQVAHYDIVHIQHEFSFFTAAQLDTIVKIIKSAHKPLVSTIHTKPMLHKTNRHILSPKGVPARMRNYVRNAFHTKRVTPLAQSDLVYVHNTFTRDGLIEVGFAADRIKLIPIPVPEITEDLQKPYRKQLDNINAKINRQPNDVVFATVGYINEMKGTMQAARALRLLPSNYKLLVLGGLHPQGTADEFLDDLTDFLINHNLLDRIYITGFVADDKLLNAYVGNADIIVYPYTRIYPSSSAALNNGFAAHKPVVASPVAAFREINQTVPYISLTESFGYYDLAKRLMELDTGARAEQAKLSKEYAVTNSYPKLAGIELADYHDLLSKK